LIENGEHDDTNIRCHRYQGGGSKVMRSAKATTVLLGAPAAIRTIVPMRHAWAPKVVSPEVAAAHQPEPACNA
jgi:hypothetical protein